MVTFKVTQYVIQWHVVATAAEVTRVPPLPPSPQTEDNPTIVAYPCEPTQQGSTPPRVGQKHSWILYSSDIYNSLTKANNHSNHPLSIMLYAWTYNTPRPPTIIDFFFCTGSN